MKLLLGGGSGSPEGKKLRSRLIQDFLGSVKKVLFITYAYAEGKYDDYTALYYRLGINAGYFLDPINLYRHKDKVKAVLEAEAICIGGGQTFCLLERLHKFGLMDPIRTQVVKKNIPYMGFSAGVNVACPGIFNSNDNPIIYPTTFKGLGLINFQIKPHYMDRDPDNPHRGETHTRRIEEFHNVSVKEFDATYSRCPVVGLREDSFLLIQNKAITLIAPAEGGAKLFLKGKEPKECFIGERLDFLSSQKRIKTNKKK